MITEIKINKIVYKIKKGDYLLYNGSCYQFCSGDGRTLIRYGLTSFSNLIIPKSTVIKIIDPILHKLEKHIDDMKVLKSGQLISYYFK